ncbi:U3 small nucleolar RNA-interacting protein 2 [Eumeta japonica]|uniref:U3 small nucleolar RNA-interacting protein 2 n=1 Tax=Eumeta variegata TaxID=151549 RepID=A0A4C1YM87_EUMVA|nr:U3 small nucleolar RNA-interacting protein 2 [Eumeta japonica]
MSSSFFLKGKSRKIVKRKGDNLKKRKSKPSNEDNLENGRDTSDSDLDLKKFSDPEDLESDQETPEQKKLRLAKKYLEEIEKEEAKRAELQEFDEDTIGKRLQKDYLDQKGKLRVQVANSYQPLSESDVRLVRVRNHRLSLTCVCVSSNGEFLFTGSKCSNVIKWGIKEKKKLGHINYKSNNTIKGAITSIAITTDSKYLAVSDNSSDIKIWDPITLKHLHIFKGHKDLVTGLVFRKNFHHLYSASKDRSVKVWSLDEMAYVETLFGHQAPVMSIDALTRERAITAGGRDSTVRIWKIVEESQLIFNGPPGSLDEVRLLDEEHFVSGSDNGAICLWSVLKKKPLCTVPEAHGIEDDVPRWITSLATILNSDVFASGSYDGNIRLWKICDSYRKVEPMFSIAVFGFVNNMQFANDGKQLYAAIGQEHKSGRWWSSSGEKQLIGYYPNCRIHQILRCPTIICSGQWHMLCQSKQFISCEDTKNWVDLWIASKNKFFRLGIRTLT